MSSPAIEIRGLTKTFGARTVLTGVDLLVPVGSAFGLLGPNGAGKTTLIRVLLGLTSPAAGSMRLLGHRLPTGRADALARVGAIVEEPRFHPFLSAYDNLRIVAAAREPAALDRIDGALARVGLTDRASDRVKTYSLGMRQRLGVARSLLGDPQLLILDEPMNGLDPAGIQEFRSMIALFVDEGRTVLLSSHLLDEVEKICDRVAIVDNGRVVVAGATADLQRRAARTIVIATSDDARAHAFLERHRGVGSVSRVADGIHVTLTSDADAETVAAEIARGLITTGLAVHRFDPRRASLEERFLDLTSRLEATT